MDDQAVEAVIQSVRAYYQSRGIFMQRFGFGKKPALIIIDMAYGWTDTQYATASARLDQAVEGIQQLLPVCRQKNIPVVYTTSPFRANEEDPMFAGGDSTASYRPWDERACEIDHRLRPEPDDLILYKDNASAFFGTHLVSYLIEQEVDTLIICGCSTSACVRATATDARAYRFKAIVPRQCVQDRAPAAHAWNLFDIDAKFGDVVDLTEVEVYLDQYQAQSPKVDPSNKGT